MLIYKDEVTNNWDNVASVSAVAILSNNNTTNYGTLFLNENHRLPVTVLLSFQLKNTSLSGPTEQEIEDALTFINYVDESEIADLSFYTENSEDFDSTYNMYYYQDAESVSRKATPNTAYQYEISYQIVPVANIMVGERYRLAIKLVATKSDGSTFTFNSGSGASSVQAEYDLNFVPEKVYLKPVDGAVSTLSYHYLKWQEAKNIPSMFTKYGNPDFNNLTADLYHITIDPAFIDGFSFHFNDFFEISGFKVLSTSECSNSWFLPSYHTNKKESVEFNDFLELIFWTYENKYRGDINNIMLTNKGINNGTTIASIIIINKDGYCKYAGYVTVTEDIPAPDYNFTLVHTATDFQHTGDTRATFGDSQYTVPLIDNYGNNIKVTVGINSDASAFIQEVN
ncbi:hypothetical protein C3432_01105 [Citrobacter amalonaticus]|uniref:Uncharacterized protein n=1 Tax=Citrobacter amalonaticus TaxID=35703 RepID=A0A2S4S282_CITAM|nr:hypothetical protein [Citrobacter amalonaticus]POT59360.1 hypothetical protein C3432_01105 [Citrobacter amalonaticus]POT77490.1 hypothetical protein C3436_08775 [Citrobacter amalonaticus]POU67942.1 hypothetical protein C3430_02310 [Citrobacter amalonaticus]POV07546.1 hypothetical protein C3424_02320 [Citrobacter amalonaticus]